MITYTYSIGAEVLHLQECSQEAKEFSGIAVLFLGFALMWMVVFSIRSLTEKIRSIHSQQGQIQGIFTLQNWLNETALSVPEA